MTKFSRRQLLAFFGASAGATILAPAFGEKLLGGNVANAVQPLKFTPIRLPHPLPIYTQQTSYLATGIGQGNVLQPSANAQLSSYSIVDDVVVPPEYERYVIVSWGDRVFPNQEDYFGYNSDYTSFIPIDGRSPNDGYLWNNHEYISYPFSTTVPGFLIDSGLGGFPTSYPLIIGRDLPEDRTNIEVLGEFMYNIGGSVVRIARPNRSGRFAVVRDPNNRRIHGLSGLGINRDRTDNSKNITSWGSRSYQQGDNNYLIGTGPSATEVFPLSSDGLGNKIIGTGFNCSGGTTPWGTVLSAEENFQASASSFVGVQELVKPNGTQTSYIEGTTGARFGLVGEKYGWMVEIDPSNQSFRPRKHTALGRFRHENIAVRAKAGQPLVGYMGDDRRGGHTWKFVSSGTVTNSTDKNNSRLFESGTLYVARYNPNGTGQWIPLKLNAPTNPIPPSTLASVEIAALGQASNNGNTRLPKRSGILGQTENGGSIVVTIETVTGSGGTISSYGETEALPAYKGKKLSDFYTSQGAVLVDAFLAANLIGATPTARPEDIEVNPRNLNEVFIAYTDGAPSGDGYPDSRIFVVSKYSSNVNAAQPSGELFKIIEDSADGTGTSFRWQRFAKGGEAGAEPGDGFANVDNLAFDSQGNIWGVTDMSTEAHNGFSTGANPEVLRVDHRVVGSNSPSADDSNFNVRTSNLIGVFGNNFLFFIPTSGPDAGEVVPFAYGPPRCELTGPTFVGDTLIISVQHPGEEVPFTPQQTLSRDIEILNLDGTLFTQKRSVPRGSNWPSNIEGNSDGPPRPSVIGIRRKQSSGRFV
ncbi:PhoX family phosphatase [Nostoc cf. edaphicum LEGE 07299]|uniref:PhoX family phosphatase n=1 Tax=Nostoc cf. edaphicum LEGE 07299 TaxID=2777974 RepID=A0ABR9U003_9NOSO|nr:PhoX family phosphatase [Nostoc edaphicum]MBE9105996.1 PhoX family phosphatase [Nostoc cf. edaphicum LEGE 07299]